METTKKETEEWYKEYYSKKGENRNNILTNSGVLFQILAFQKSMIEALRTLPPIRGEVLDVGCGDGGSLLPLISLGFDPDCLYGIDIIQERIEGAKKRFPNVKFTCGDGSQMNYDSDYFVINDIHTIN